MKKTNEICEVQIKYVPRRETTIKRKVNCSEDAVTIFREKWEDDISFVESFNVIYLNRANFVLGVAPISKGGVSGTVIDPKVIFSGALKAMASGMILAHNHPSGNLQPSEADIRLTKNLKASGILLEIAVLDHLIITEDSFFSFTDEGLF